MLGLGKMSPEKIEKMMKRLGIETRKLEAEEVLIRCKDKDIIIKNPEVLITNVMGKDAYQITGDVEERGLGPSEEDIKLVMEKTGKDRETVVAKLEELNNDLAKAIMELKGND